jgi:hypothetical protein
VLLALLLPGCAAPYQAATTTTGLPVPERRLLELFVRHFPSLEYHGSDPLALRSAWTNDADPSVAVQRRGFLTVTPDPAVGLARIDVVVQRRVLRAPPLSLPAWVEAGGDRRLEDRILAEIEALIGAGR